MKYIKFCHRMPERTFSIKGHYFPVCARCTGFYVALFFILIINFLYKPNYSFELFVLGIFLLMPVAIDGTTQLMGLRESNNPLRFVTGFVGGFGLFFIMKFCIDAIKLMVGL